MDQARGNSVQPRLGLWDAVSIIVGIIIGVGIFEIPSKIFQMVPGPLSALGVWTLGGVLALIGALCFAELTSTYPRSGGDYVYLTRAYGSLVGFLFAWAQLAVIRPGSIGAIAYVFADYAVKMWDLDGSATLVLAIGSVVCLTGINILGVNLGKNTQNLLTGAKVLGLAAIVVVGLVWAKPGQDTIATSGGEEGWFATAMILVLWTYAGWNEAAFIVAEVRDGRRNIPMALILGTTAVTLIYLAINMAFLLALGFERASGKTVPAEILALVWGPFGAKAISILIMISALGAINGMIFTTARIYSEFGADHRLFQPLSKWSRRWGTPVRALLVQGGITIALMAGISLWLILRDTQVPEEKTQQDSAPHPSAPHVESPQIGANRENDPEIRIKDVGDGLNEMIYVTAPVFWLFFLLTGASVMVLRAKDPDLPRPFRVPLYPLLPLVFCLSCAYMAIGAILFRKLESLIGLLILVAGILFYFLPKKIKRERVKEPNEPTPAGVA